jgi:hypothetical protein
LAERTTVHARNSDPPRNFWEELAGLWDDELRAARQRDRFVEV